jgi:hypothetical protein
MKPSLLSINAPRTRRVAATHWAPASRLSLQIDEVALIGFEQVDSERLRAALQQSLASAIEDGGQFKHDVHFEKAGGKLKLLPGSDARDIGTTLGNALAQTIHTAGRISGQPARRATGSANARQSKGRR